jgi:hypothetical protein
MPNPPIGPPGSVVVNNTPIQLPVIPKATDLPSALGAIQALTQAINILTNAIPSNSAAQSTASSTPAVTASAFQQTNIQLKTIRVTDPNDSSVFVDVEQIVGLTLYDPVTKQTWQWHQ